ncbi:MAG TPA: hypothetical protein DCR46_07005 [Cytophagales bacterium]|nr:hypothetical protein [Cytophagales bacterium]
MLGICAYNLVAVRANDSDKSEMVTQLLFGDVYAVKEESENGKWIQIEIADDGYCGWIDKKLHSPIEEAYCAQLQKSEQYYCAEVVGFLKIGEANQPLFFGSYLPLFDQKNCSLNAQEAIPFFGKAEKISKCTSGDEIVQRAKLYLSTPYLWGGKSHAGIDCSGLVQMVFRSCGYKLKRDAYQQATMGTAVNSLSEARSGDLAFFSNDTGKIIHVGILINSKEIIHAHGKVRTDKIDKKGIINGDSGLYSHQLSSIISVIRT